MVTLNNIFKEIENVPVDRLEEVFQFVQSLTPNNNSQSENNKQKILSYGGSFSSMSDKDYKDYKAQTKKTRSNLFDRTIEL